MTAILSYSSLLRDHFTHNNLNLADNIAVRNIE